MSKMVRLLLVIGILAFGMYGCDDSDSTPPTTIATTTTTTTTLAVTTVTTPAITVDANGTLSQALTVNTAGSGNAKTATSSLTLPQGAVATLANGTPAVGSLTVTATVSEGTTNTLLPGQTFDQTVDGVAGTLQPAGIVSIEIKDRNGNAVNQFSQDIELTGSIDPTVINPNTGRAYAAGDEIDLFYASSPFKKFKRVTLYICTVSQRQVLCFKVTWPKLTPIFKYFIWGWFKTKPTGATT